MDTFLWIMTSTLCIIFHKKKSGHRKQLLKIKILDNRQNVSQYTAYLFEKWHNWNNLVWHDFLLPYFLIEEFFNNSPLSIFKPHLVCFTIEWVFICFIFIDDNLLCSHILFGSSCSRQISTKINQSQIELLIINYSK